MAARFHTGTAGVVGDFVVCGDTSTIQNIWDGGGTATAWIFVDSYGQVDFGRIADKDGLSLHGWIWFVDGTTANNRFGFNVIFSGADGQWALNTGTIVTGQWYHVAVLYNSDSAANNPAFYIDGVSQTVNEIVGPSGSRTSDVGARLVVGQRFAYDRAFDGTIADFRLYDRELSAGEILTMFTGNGGDNIITGLLLRHPLSPVRESLGLNTPWRDDTEASVASSASVTVNVPTHTNGDLLVLVLNDGGNTSGTAPNITTPSGWTQRIHFDFPVTASTPAMALYTRIASSEPASYAVSSNQTSPKVGFITAYPGIASEVPDTSATGTGTTASPVSPTITPSGPALVLRVAGMDSDTNEPTIRGDFFASNIRGRRVLSTSGGGSNGVVTGIGEEMSDGAAVGTRTWSGSASDQWGALSIAWLHGAGIEGLPAKDISSNATNCEAWHQIIGAEDQLKIGGC